MAAKIQPLRAQLVVLSKSSKFLYAGLAPLSV
jgi:hypothetical protein